MQKPDVDLIEGLSPAISIEQKTTCRNPRSTVGTVTEIHDYMRLLWARVGVPYSPATGLPIESQTVSQMVDNMLALPRRHAPLPAGAGGARPQGRVPQGDRRAAEAGLPAPEDRRRVLPDRGRAGPRQEVQARHRRGGGPPRRARPTWRRGWPIASRRRCGWPTASPSPNGPTSVDAPDGEDGKAKNETHERILFSEKFACPVSGFTIAEIEPRLFSFNNPFGACPACDGLGSQARLRRRPGRAGQGRDPAQGRGRALGEVASPLYTQTLQALARHYGFTLDEPWQQAARRGPASDPARHRRARRSTSSTTTACATTR